MPLPAAERRAAGFVLLVFLLAMTLPYALAPLLLPSGSVWGGLLGSADDQNVHLMWARQARDGAFFFRDLFTTESLTSGQKPLFFNVLPALMGVLARLFGCDVVFPYHFARVALAAWALWQCHQLFVAATEGAQKWSRARVLALALLCFSTGAGFFAPLSPSRVWIDRPDGSFPLMPEAFFALSGLFYPLNIASFGLLALLFRLMLEKRGAFPAFVAAALLGNIHTYDALPLLLTATLWALWQAKNRDGAAARIALAAIAGALLPVVYQLIVFRGSEEFRVKALTVTAPPDALSMLLNWSPLLILGAFGLPKWRELPATRLLLLWIVAVFALVYAPTSVFSFARKMLEGVQIPLVFLAALGLSQLVARFSSPLLRRGIAGLVLGALLISPAQFGAWLWQNTLENNASRWRVLMPPLALSRGDAAALRFLDARRDAGAVLCLPFLGSYVPRAAAHWTYAGHWAETLRFGSKFPLVARFYRGQMARDEALLWLRQNRIRWVIEGQFERSLSGGVSMGTQLGLRPLFRAHDAPNGITTVFAAP